jgi:hypothetical protein
MTDWIGENAHGFTTQLLERIALRALDHALKNDMLRREHGRRCSIPVNPSISCMMCIAFANGYETEIRGAELVPGNSNNRKRLAQLSEQFLC